MEQEITKMALTQGLWAVLFVVLLFYVLRTNEKRETRLLDTLNKVTGDLSENVLQVRKDVEDLACKVEAIVTLRR